MQLLSTAVIHGNMFSRLLNWPDLTDRFKFGILIKNIYFGQRKIIWRSTMKPPEKNFNKKVFFLIFMKTCQFWVFHYSSFVVGDRHYLCVGDS